MREKVLRELAARAAEDHEFLIRARADLRGTLAADGYRLTGLEMRLVEGLWNRTTGMTDEELARMLASGLARRDATPPARPTAPGWRGSDTGDGPTRPTRPGR